MPVLTGSFVCWVELLVSDLVVLRLIVVDVAFSSLEIFRGTVIMRKNYYSHMTNNVCYNI